ncbi:glycoside hydrolase family 3 N-terminal domain-containing protein [Streptomyces liangshanensis]|uniref:Beta-N-acetylhexosaminidase n=1 Tax=Streptomyces liangshanensis TaxID=2717324 RepID=A0A6G9H2T1_9ACTN|nr:glycoside hydrolase family 3 N-terminal domain-containing protein [Streptomyces liangshanensis]QIQ04599.1 beta-N-acetylhexosaminidase [Streptomyces liangshanensis]
MNASEPPHIGRRAVLAGSGAVAAALALGGRALFSSSASPSASSAASPSASSSGSLSAEPAAYPRAAAVPKGLTERQLAGQRVIYSYPGHTPPAALLKKISAGEGAGVIFFGENITSAAQIAAVVKQLEKANRSSPVRLPLLLMTDQEGGTIRRLPGAPALSEKQIGLAADPVAAAKAAGTGAGKNLAAAGLNLNLAPVLDVYRTAGDFTDHAQRSYGRNAAQVGKLGAAFVTAQQHVAVAATAKHFPGLGAAATHQNTDLGPVTLTQSLTTLRNVDEAPYKQAVAAGTRLVMLSWAVYPALDAKHPAGLSAAVVKELRSHVGFKGVTITDALEAKAISHTLTTGRRAVLAAGAGMDLLLCSSRQVSQGESAVTALTTALHNKTLPTPAFHDAVSRLTALRTALS